MNKSKKLSKKQVKEYWTDVLVSMEKFDSEYEFMEADYCFACGMLVNHNIGSFNGTKKIYIESMYNLDKEHPSNIHYLCALCHPWAKKNLKGWQYWKWFAGRTSNDILTQIKMAITLKDTLGDKKNLEGVSLTVEDKIAKRSGTHKKNK